MGQFSLLVIVNAFVGGMVGLERTILPELAQADFAIASQSAILSFVIIFGVTKAIANYYAGRWASQVGRKNLLVLGWIVALPIAPLLMWAPSWNWVLVANGLLGINQGLAWSSTVVMKIDLVGPNQRGLAMGINEFAGYVAVGLAAFGTGWIAATYGLRPYPFYLGIGLSVIGLLLSTMAVRDTASFVRQEEAHPKANAVPKMTHPFAETTWRNPVLSSITQAGLVNNLNDGMVWGLFPLLLAGAGLSLSEVAVVVAIYPAVWGVGQLITGRLADVWSHRTMLSIGMMVQAAALSVFLLDAPVTRYVLGAIVLGVGTAVVYPTFLVAISAATHPADRAASIGVFRMWRDLGYAIGALLTGVIADLFSIQAAVATVALLTLGSGGVVWVRMPNHNAQDRRK